MALTLTPISRSLTLAERALLVIDEFCSLIVEPTTDPVRVLQAIAERHAAAATAVPALQSAYAKNLARFAAAQTGLLIGSSLEVSGAF